MLEPVVVAVGAALAVAGLAAAAPQRDTYNLTAELRARFEIPKPAGVPARAVGRFTGKAVELQSAKARLTWRLTFSRLSGRAQAAHVHVGKRGKAGSVMVALCGPCRSGQRGTATITRRQLRTIRAGAAYVNVHTAKNPAGEIRGQLEASAGSPASGGTEPAPPPTDPAPPPYPPYP